MPPQTETSPPPPRKALRSDASKWLGYVLDMPEGAWCIITQSQRINQIGTKMGVWRRIHGIKVTCYQDDKGRCVLYRGDLPERKESSMKDEVDIKNGPPPPRREYRTYSAISKYRRAAQALKPGEWFEVLEKDEKKVSAAIGQWRLRSPSLHLTSYRRTTDGVRVILCPGPEGKVKVL